MEYIYYNLIQSLKLVASPHHIQIASLPDYVNVADEIALIYNDSYIMLPQICSIISQPNVIKMFDELNKLFEDMSKDKSLWNNKSLEENVFWKVSRELGQLILNELNEKNTNPNLDFIHWVKKY